MKYPPILTSLFDRYYNLNDDQTSETNVTMLEIRSNCVRLQINVKVFLRDMHQHYSIIEAIQASEIKKPIVLESKDVLMHTGLKSSIIKPEINNFEIPIEKTEELKDMIIEPASDRYDETIKSVESFRKKTKSKAHKCTFCAFKSDTEAELKHHIRTTHA